MDNLRQEIVFCEEWVSQIIGLLDAPLRRELFCLIRSRASRNARCRECYQVSDRGTERWVEHIFSDIGTGSLKMTEKELESHINQYFERNRILNTKNGQPRPHDAISKLQHMFSMNREETEVLCLLMCISEIKLLNNFFEQCSFHEFVTLVGIATEIPTRKVRSILQRSGKLFVSGLISGRDEPNGPHFPINYQVMEFVAGLDDIPLRDRYIREDRGKIFPVTSFHISESSIRIIEALLTSTKPCSILIYGNAGTGKTEFARTVIAHAGKRAFFTQNGLLISDPNQSHSWRENRWDIQVAAHLLPADTGVLILDEADSLLNTRYFIYGKKDTPEKSWLNALLDESKIKMIWITNDTEYIEESALRRFSFSLHFKSFTCRERKNAWQNLIQRHPLRRFLPPPLIEELASRYHVNTAGIASALKALREIIHPEAANKETVTSMLNELLKRHEEAIRQNHSNSLNLLTDKYDLSALNTDVDPMQILESLQTFICNQRARGANAANNINLLFLGPPGTGKTELAKYLANKLSMGICFKRASDLLSMWVGGTEHNIKEAFEEIEDDQSILLIDEADSFFINRQTALRSWEVSQTNELLTQMENHKGILICCTNLLDTLDRAVLRRFVWKIEFKPLTMEGRLKLCRKYFVAAGTALSPDEQQQLARMHNLTPGDIKAVWQKFQFYEPRQLNYGVIIRALENEIKYRHGNSNPIGFN
jgi:SpoVK/Ycf46/Vps4 family AAA+-type ATPase